MAWRPPISTLFPYTTLFRSISPPARAAEVAARFGWDVRSYPGRGHLLQLERGWQRSEEHTSELQSLTNIVCRLLLAKKKSTCSRRLIAARLRKITSAVAALP